jgi:hypothetical protein
MASAAAGGEHTNCGGSLRNDFQAAAKSCEMLWYNYRYRTCCVSRGNHDPTCRYSITQDAVNSSAWEHKQLAATRAETLIQLPIQHFDYSDRLPCVELTSGDTSSQHAKPSAQALPAMASNS